MGSPAAYVFVNLSKKNNLQNILLAIAYKILCILLYIEDIIAVIQKSESDNILIYFNDENSHIKFTMEKELNNKLPYLYILLIRDLNG